MESKTFEDKIRELEAIIKELEEGEVNLDDAIEKYKLMPMLGYDKETLEEISSYLYDLTN